MVKISSLHALVIHQNYSSARGRIFTTLFSAINKPPIDVPINRGLTFLTVLVNPTALWTILKRLRVCVCHNICKLTHEYRITLTATDMDFHLFSCLFVVPLLVVNAPPVGGASLTD